MMQNLKNSNIMHEEIKELMIPIDKVAHVQLENPVEHALLVLIKSGYSAIPVLDTSYKLHGQISKALILDSILGLERIELERLGEYKVKDVMDPKMARMKQHENFSRALTLSINHPFVCIEDENGAFVGILTRKSILALIHRYLRKT